MSQVGFAGGTTSDVDVAGKVGESNLLFFLEEKQEVLRRLWVLGGWSGADPRKSRGAARSSGKADGAGEGGSGGIG